MYIVIQFTTNADSLAPIYFVKSQLPNIFEKIDNVRDMAIRTEDFIVIMTVDIQKLDLTKRNMKPSMSALKELLMPSRYQWQYLV